MKHRPTRSLLSMAMIGSMSAALLWSSDSLACSPEPYVSAVCIMAISWTNLNGYAPANGATMNVSQNQVLFSLIGTTYGGNGTTTFMLPDLQGRVVIGAGAGAGLPVYNVGDKGGAASVMLTSANVPLVPHTHSLSGVVVTAGLGSLAANTTLTGLTATTSLSSVTATAAGSGLTLNATNASGGTGTPGGGTLASTGLTKIYSNATPNVAMSAGSISGTAPVTFAGNPTTTISGTPTTTLTGAPSVALSGSTGPAGSNPTAAVNIMQPYLAMNYFIATQGVYPSRN